MSHPYIAFEYIDFCDNFSVNRADLRARFQCVFRAYFQCDFVCTISMYFCVIPFFLQCQGAWFQSISLCVQFQCTYTAHNSSVFCVIVFCGLFGFTQFGWTQFQCNLLHV